MPSKPSEPAPKKWGSLSPVDGGNNAIPPWERSNLGYSMGEAKADSEVKARITPSMTRAIQRIVQQRKVPQIETQSDVVRLGIFWVLWWAANVATDDEQLRDLVDLQMWEAEVAYRDTVYERTNKLLDTIERQLVMTKQDGRTREHQAILGELHRNKEKITDEKLKARATRLWLQYHDPAK